MDKVSRRQLIAGAVAAPITVKVAGAHTAAPPDPVIAKAAAWITLNNQREAMIRKWQGLESLLFDQARVMKLDAGKACRSNMPEARAMRAQDRRIDAAWSQLGCMADQAVAMHAMSVEGAIAKVELGLAVQGPFDWTDPALDLLNDGLEELRGLLLCPGRCG